MELGSIHTRISIALLSAVVQALRQMVPFLGNKSDAALITGANGSGGDSHGSGSDSGRDKGGSCDNNMSGCDGGGACSGDDRGIGADGGCDSTGNGRGNEGGGCTNNGGCGNGGCGNGGSGSSGGIGDGGAAIRDDVAKESDNSTSTVFFKIEQFLMTKTSDSFIISSISPSSHSLISSLTDICSKSPFAENFSRNIQFTDQLFVYL